MDVKVNDRKLVYKGRVFNLFCDNVTLTNGRSVNLDIIRNPGAAAIVAVTENNEIILLKQYRYAAKDFIWEIPAGTLDPEEPHIMCAQRELIEESGYYAKEWKKIGEIIPVPGYSDEKIHIFLAAGLELAQQDLDDDEILNVFKINIKEAFKMIYSGEIFDAKTIVGIFLASAHLK